MGRGAGAAAALAAAALHRLTRGLVLAVVPKTALTLIQQLLTCTFSDPPFSCVHPRISYTRCARQQLCGRRQAECRPAASGSIACEVGGVGGVVRRDGWRQTRGYRQDERDERRGVHSSERGRGSSEARTEQQTKGADWAPRPAMRPALGAGSRRAGPARAHQRTDQAAALAPFFSCAATWSAKVKPYSMHLPRATPAEQQQYSRGRRVRHEQGSGEQGQSPPLGAGASRCTAHTDQAGAGSQPRYPPPSGSSNVLSTTRTTQSHRHGCKKES